MIVGLRRLTAKAWPTELGGFGPHKRQKARPQLLVLSLLSASLLTACTHTPVLTQPFPPSPVANLGAPLPMMSKLPEKAALSDIMRAHLADAEAFQHLVAEIQTWRAWFIAQSASKP